MQVSSFPWATTFTWLLLTLRVPMIFASEPMINNGAFETTQSLPTGCYAIRRTERSGFEKYYSGELVMDPWDKPGTPPIIGPSGAPLTSREDAYSDIVRNHVADILCVGDVITIATPLRSNGGDVLILANRLDVRASIDSRIYFNIANRKRYYRNSQSIGAAHERFFASYYRDNPEGVQIGETINAPEFPSGSTIRFPSRFETVDGSPPPPIPEADRELAQSGAIMVFAKKIEIADGLQQGLLPPSELCAPPGSIKPFAFQAGGVRGGKGSLGSVPLCSSVGGHGPYCADEAYVNSGLSGSPGAGGDAGKVSLYHIGNPFSDSEQAQLRQAANVAGGPSGPIAVYRTLDAREVQAGVPDNICDRATVGMHAAAAMGTAGELNFGHASVLQALERADAFALSNDGRPSVDIRDLVERARSDHTVEHRSMQEFLRSNLSHVALAANRTWAEQLARQVAGQQISAIPSIEPFSSISDDLARTRYMQISPNISGLVQRLSDLDISPGGNLASAYFSRTAGAFSVANPDATAAITGKLIVDTLTDVFEANAEQLLELTGMELALNEELYIVRRDALLAKINAVQQRIAEIQAIPARTGASFGDIVASIDKASPAISAFVAAVVSGNYMAARQAYPAAMNGINDVYNTAYGEVASGAARPGLLELKAALRGLNLDLRDLNAAYADARESLINVRYYYAARELAIRHRVATRLDGRLPYGEDLIKHSFVTYFLDPRRNKNYLVENLNESAIFLSGQVDYTSNLRLLPLDNACQLDPDGKKNYAACLVLAPSSQYRFVETSIAGAFRFPAWIVSPRNRNTVWPTFNAPTHVTKVRTLDDAARYGKSR
ncbi:hypothetical protein KDW69_13540 [Burkholderia ambifaria]|uniref:hypothetical protein n=1 Tax=Burkholderia ambifaria TaxID=152480 RepID=UPI001B9B76D1|nr:hypothetical protein [Burkholderia ambifaria]MBR8332664.1 hypothetical protein [Burkholderia ambifaria]